MPDDAKSNKPSRVYLNSVMTVIALLLALLVAQATVGAPSAARASAEPRRSRGAPIGLPNPSDERLAIRRELEGLNHRLDRLVKILDGKPLEVKVVNMPAVKD